MNSIDDDVRVSRRVYIPSSKLRGFETGKFGPKDGEEYVGGNFGSAINLNTTVPSIFTENENLDLSLFFDAATLREVDYDSSLESSEIRSSTGVSINWYTVIGPLSLLMGKEVPNLLWLMNPIETIPAAIKSFFPPKPPGEEKETKLETCLLYTSPSPRDKRQYRMPSSA